MRPKQASINCRPALRTPLRADELPQPASAGRPIKFARLPCHHAITRCSPDLKRHCDLPKTTPSADGARIPGRLAPAEGMNGLIPVTEASVAFATSLSCVANWGIAPWGELMARAPRQNVTIHYRRLEDATGAFGQKTLQAAIKKAMAHTIGAGKLSEHWKLRAWAVPPATEDTILMNLHDDHREYFLVI
jgi:hypothetical protein